MLMRPLGKPISNQLIRSVGSISANIEERYGRGFYGRERTQLLRIALGLPGKVRVGIFEQRLFYRIKF
ncbi:MAG: four helix bundle protein [Anaerolineales bacterium]|nr:four helix bundle protein [Anaerolineales bacterium]